MTYVTFKDNAGNEVEVNEISSFSGFEIKTEYNKVSSITEFNEGEVLGTISFRPTKTPVIFSVKYGNYREERYSHGGVSAIWHSNADNKINGEYRRYSTDGTLHEVRYFTDGKEVTTDIMKFIGYTGSTEEFINYKFGEDEKFNIWLQYGSYFKFINECEYDPNHFNGIVQYCLK